MVLLDTDVLVDCLRGTEPAQQWLETVESATFYVPGIVAMELVAGCRDKTDLQHVQRFLDAFPVLWPDAADFAQAYDLLVKYRLGVGIGIPDCLIASMALRRSARLYTFNWKHFRAIPELDVQQPYERS
jgi:predicted nucleic acid-binding protein